MAGKKKICATIYFAALSSVNPNQLRRYGWLSPCCVCAAQKMNASETVWIYVMCVFSLETGFVPSLRAGQGHLIDRHPCGYAIDYLTEFHACVCVCAHLMLSVTECCSSHRPSHLLFTVTPVDHK